MVEGIRKVARNSGQILDMAVEVVYATDLFDYELGDRPYIRHKRGQLPEGAARGPVIAAYSIVYMKDSAISREVMERDQIDRVRAMAKTDYIWSRHFDEMAKKTVFHRHFKRLPKSRDLDTVLRRDEALYDLAGASDQAKVDRTSRPSLNSRLDLLANDVSTDTVKAEVVTETATETKTEKNAEPSPEDIARKQGFEAAKAGVERKAVPGEYREDEKLSGAWLAGFDQAKAPA
jgi:recombination protein RecT